ncbi:hypothetical protein QR685DRAFT_576199 [Neurospora intermedia]|uniref:Uncharacterized protein n=1 Tax=Neurospora intermedia TaxID=5142 RepID=A0ABR3CY44_NEUIN
MARLAPTTAGSQGGKPGQTDIWIEWMDGSNQMGRRNGALKVLQVTAIWTTGLTRGDGNGRRRERRSVIS